MKISVIIPTLNEAKNIAPLINYIYKHGGQHIHTIIVVDGGSKDDTISLAEQAGATVLSSPPSRAKQMNLGAAHARDIYSKLDGNSGKNQEGNELFLGLNGSNSLRSFSTFNHTRETTKKGEKLYTANEITIYGLCMQMGCHQAALLLIYILPYSDERQHDVSGLVGYHRSSIIKTHDQPNQIRPSIISYVRADLTNEKGGFFGFVMIGGVYDRVGRDRSLSQDLQKYGHHVPQYQEGNPCLST